MLSRSIGRRLAGLGLSQNTGVSWLSSVADQPNQPKSNQSVIDELVGYSRSHFKGNHDQALDIIKSGLQYHNKGHEASRLYLAQADIESDRSNWTSVSTLCQTAATAALETKSTLLEDQILLSEVELTAASMGTFAFLTQNKDAEAFNLAQQCMEVARKSFTNPNLHMRRREGLALASGVAAAVQHAGGEFQAASESFEAVIALVNHSDPRHGPEPPLPDHVIPRTLKQAALHRLAQGALEEAAVLASRAIHGAERAVEEGEGSSTPMQSPLRLGEVLADSYLAAGQIAIKQTQWEAAENYLSQALKAAESVSTEVHPRVALVLMLVGGVYSRTGRVTLAEGLYREAAKMLDLAPSRQTQDSSSGGGVVTLGPQIEFKHAHPSIGALLAWRYAQLLTALPNRTTEASAWLKLGRDLYDDAPIGRVLTPESSLGTMDTLQGKGSPGYGVVVDLSMRRALSCLPGTGPGI